MGRAVRWLVASLLVLAVFAVVTWLAGVVITPHWRSLGEADRWVIATAAGVVAGTFAGLGGYGWVTRARGTRADNPAGVAGRDNTGIISTGDNATNVQDR